MQFGSYLVCCIMLSAVIGTLTITSHSEAALVWEFNSTTKTAALKGTTDTLSTPFDFGGGSTVIWGADITIPDGGTSASFYETTATATYNLPSPILVSNNTNNDNAGYFPGFDFDPNAVRYFLSIDGDTPPAAATISGTGIGSDYSGWDPEVIAFFEALTPSAPLVLPPLSGTSGDSLTVYAIPEPSTLALAALGLTTLGLRRWRRRA